MRNEIDERKKFPLIAEKMTKICKKNNFVGLNIVRRKKNIKKTLV